MRLALREGANEMRLEAMVQRRRDGRRGHRRRPVRFADGTRSVARGLSILLAGLMGAAVGTAEELDGAWKMAARREQDDFVFQVYVEAEPAAGRPTFRIEARYDAAPAIAAATLMDSMSREDSTMSGERRKLLERTATGALVHTFIDLPMLFADRELALRIEHSRDAERGIHRIEWVEANDRLPEPARGVLRLRSSGYWEFRPEGTGRSAATYVSRAEVGGSLPAALSNRLMRGQAEDAVTRLRDLIAERARTDVAAPPPGR